MRRDNEKRQQERETTRERDNERETTRERERERLDHSLSDEHVMKLALTLSLQPALVGCAQIRTKIIGSNLV